MNAAFLPSANRADGPAIERIPDWPQNFMNVGDTVGFGPPWCKPGNAMVLIHHQIKGLLLAIPLDGFEHRLSATAPSYNLDAVDRFCGNTAGVFIGKPIDLMPAFPQRSQIAFGHSLGAARFGIFWIPPVQHQETHDS